MSDVFTFSSYWFYLLPAELRRTRELINAKLKTSKRTRNRTEWEKFLKVENCTGLLVSCKMGINL